jgi:hypothetical protein
MGIIYDSEEEARVPSKVVVEFLTAIPKPIRSLLKLSLLFLRTPMIICNMLRPMSLKHCRIIGITNANEIFYSQEDEKILLF